MRGRWQSFLQGLAHPVCGVGVAAVVKDPAAPAEALHRQSGHRLSSGIEARHSAAECTCFVLQSAKQGTGDTTSTRRRSHVHAFDLGDAVGQAADPAAGDDSVVEFD